MRRLSLGLLYSLLFHAGLYGGAVGFFAWRDSRAGHTLEIDLAGSSLLKRVENPQGGKPRFVPPQPWYLPGKGMKTPPLPQPVSATPEAEEAAGPPCPPPCPENAGDWIPASAASRRPVWSAGLITEDDYPAQARREGREGRVVVDLLIDGTGAVKAVEMVSGAGPDFDKLVLERLKASRFHPAYDNDGNAVACRLRLPIIFELR